MPSGHGFRHRFFFKKKRTTAGAKLPYRFMPVLFEKAGHKALPTRTSASHPITVSWLDAGDARDGALGLCYCPGKNVVREGVRWARDLQADLQHLISAHGVGVVVCLLSDAELRALGVGRDYCQTVRRAGLELIQLPIIEMFAPDDIESTAAAIESICNLLEGGSKVVLHCRGGVGRAGMLGACLLMRMGLAMGPKEAIQLVRRKRCKRAVESRSQEKFVLAYARHREHCDAPGGGRVIHLREGVGEREEKQPSPPPPGLERFDPSCNPFAQNQSGRMQEEQSPRDAVGSTGRNVRNQYVKASAFGRMPLETGRRDSAGSRTKEPRHISEGRTEVSRTTRDAPMPQNRLNRPPASSGIRVPPRKVTADRTLRERAVREKQHQDESGEEASSERPDLEHGLIVQDSAVKAREIALEEELAKCDAIMAQHEHAARTELRRGPLPSITRRAGSARGRIKV